MIAARQARPAAGRREAAASSTPRAHPARAARADSSSCCGPATRDRQRRRDAAGEPARASRCRRGSRSRGRGSRRARSLRAGRCAALHRRRLRRGRLSHADRGSRRCRRRSTPGDRLRLGPLTARVDGLLGHPRLVALRFDGASRAGLGRPRAPRPADPVRAHARSPRAVGCLDADRRRRRSRSSRRRPASCSTGSRSRRCASDGIGFATITHAAGISSTGDAGARPRGCRSTSRIASRRDRAGDRRARRERRPRSSRSARRSCARSNMRQRAWPRCVAGDGVARRSASARDTPLRVVDAILSGTHEPGTSHYELLRAFAGDATPAQRGSRRSTRRLSHARVRRFGAD